MDSEAPTASHRGVGVNHVTLVGRVAANPEMVSTRAGMKARLRLATNERAAAEFHTVTAWGPLATLAGEYLRVGRLVYLEGRIHNTSWETASGEKRYSYEVVAEALQFLDSPERAA